ncbi:MAG: glycosyltransferase [archaeon GW2011_AR10]|nr:MAG: glycosyltransferase [archaeon GW2011_AR10]
MPFLAQENRAKLLLLLLAIAFLVRVYAIDRPILEVMSTRQALTAMTARNLNESNFDLLHPEIDLFEGREKSYYALELHVMPAITALLYSLFGVQEWIGRLVSILFFLGALIFMFLLLEKFFNLKVAFIGSLFFSLSPLTVIYARTFQPESSMLFFMVGALYFFSEWVDRQGNAELALSAVFTSLALLIKPTAIAVLPAIAFLAFNKFGWKALSNWKAWAAIILVPSIALVAWSYWAFLLQQESPGSFASVLGGWLQRDLEELTAVTPFSPELYFVLFERLAGRILTPIGFALAAIGLMLKPEKKAQLVFHFFLLGGLISFLVFYWQNFVHDYYQLPLAAALAAFVGIGGNAILESRQIRERVIDKRIIAAGLVLLVGTTFYYYTLQAFHPYTKTPGEHLMFVEAGEKVDSLIEKDAKVLVASENAKGLLYYTDRKGNVFAVGQTNAESIENLQEKIGIGFTHFLYAKTKNFALPEEIHSYLKENFETVLAEEEKYYLYDLSPD